METKRIFKLAMLVLGLATLVLASQPAARAADEDDGDDFLESASRGTEGRMPAYVGARDEQKLEIQATLPQPTRGADGSSAVAASHDDEPAVETPPASD